MSDHIESLKGHAVDLTTMQMDASAVHATRALVFANLAIAEELKLLRQHLVTTPAESRRGKASS
jgi:hypothetical protein